MSIKYVDLDGLSRFKSKLGTIPTKTSQLNNDSGYITKSVNNLDNYTKTSSLSSVATSGSYNDLSNKPTIPTKTSQLNNDSNFITNTGSTTGNSGTATKLQTPRSIAIGTGGTGTATNFDGSANITIPLTDVKDSYVTWGGKSLTNLSPNDMGCVDEFGHNKLAFLNPSCITVQYTTNGGTSWIDYGLTDAQKIAMVTTSGAGVGIGKGTATATVGTLTNANCGNYKVRVKISTRKSDGNANLYTQARKILINMSTNGAGGCKVLVENRTIANYNAGNDTWATVGTFDVSGWSGWNSIPYVYTFGGGVNQTGQIADVRITLSITSVNTSYSCVAQLIDFRLIGATNWTMPSELARAGHLYTMDTSQNATFPGTLTANKIDATKLNGTIPSTCYTNTTYTDGTAGYTLKAKQDKDGNQIDTTYYKASNPSGYTTLSAVKNAIYPVGSIYISVNNTNPSTLFGGTWEAFGVGKTLIGVDSNDTDFNASLKTGGEKTHTLTKSEVPKLEGELRTNQWGANGATYSNGDFTGTYSQYVYNMTTYADSTGRDRFTTVHSTYGGDGSHNNLQPYITVYMWRRTA